MLLIDWITCVLPSHRLVGLSVRDAYGSGGDCLVAFEICNM